MPQPASLLLRQLCLLKQFGVPRLGEIVATQAKTSGGGFIMHGISELDRTCLT